MMAASGKLRKCGSHRAILQSRLRDAELVLEIPATIFLRYPRLPLSELSFLLISQFPRIESVKYLAEGRSELSFCDVLTVRARVRGSDRIEAPSSHVAGPKFRVLSFRWV